MVASEVAGAGEAALDDALTVAAELAVAAELVVAATGFADLPLPLTAAAMTPITKKAAMARRMTFRLLGLLRPGGRGGGTFD